MQFQDYLSFENIYLWTNLSILPLWLMLIIIPNSKFTKFFVNSIILPLILSTIYIYIVYQTILLDEPIFDVIKLYLNLDNLYTVFATESFLLIFWLHFLALNLFLGSWISRDGVKYSVPRGLISVPLIFAFFTGPLGLVLYWVVRVFYAKRINLHD